MGQLIGLLVFLYENIPDINPQTINKILFNMGYAAFWLSLEDYLTNDTSDIEERASTKQYYRESFLFSSDHRIQVHDVLFLTTNSTTEQKCTWVLDYKIYTFIWVFKVVEYLFEIRTWQRCKVILITPWIII